MIIHIINFTAICDDDAGSYTVQIPANTTTFKYNFSIFDDNLFEINEVIHLYIQSHPLYEQVNHGNSNYSATINIENDDNREYFCM